MTEMTDKAFEQATTKLKEIGDKIDDFPRSVAIFLYVYSVQGVFDNGGYRYFFETDCPDNPPYSKFIDAYSAIGCIKQSNDLSRVVSSFPFDNPHLHEPERIKYIENTFDDDEYEVKGWGDSEFWEKLEAFYRNN